MAGNENSGRDTHAFKHRLQRILDDPKVEERIKKIMAHTKRDDMFFKGFELLSDRVYGKPTQSHNVDANVEIKINMINYADNNPA